MKHGLGGYTNHRCRCEICTAAHTAYQVAWKGGVRARTPPDAPDHGTYARYCNYGCRCGPCRAANTARGRSRWSRIAMLVERELSEAGG